MMIQKGRVKSLIVKHGLQSTDNAIKIIDKNVYLFLESVILKAKSQGAKRLMDDSAKYFDNKKTMTITNEKVNCTRCVNILDIYIKWARQIQGFCHDEATLLLNRLLKSK
tara:strand:- start:4373 stop:4702 length:330 start_codon:yes stop_codon:yes gene_type:complete